MINNYLISATYFLIFFPYITVTRLFDSDVQPYAGLLALVYLVINYRNIRLEPPALCLLILSSVALLYNFFGFNEDRQIFKFISIPYALVIYVFISNTLDKYNITIAAYKYAIVYIFFCFFQYIFPDLYFEIFSYLVREVKVAELGGMRGVSALTTEPSFTAFVLIILMGIVYYTENSISALKKNILFFFVITSVLLTKSLTGVVLILAFLSWELMRKANLVLILSALICFVFALSVFKDTRAVEFLIFAFTSPLEVLSESSLFFRVYYFVYGLVSLIYNPLGASLGEFNMEEVRGFTDHLFVNHVPYHTLIRIEPSVNMPSSFGANMYLYGIFYALSYLIIFGMTFLSPRVPFQIKWFVFVLTAQSFSFSFTLLWVLLALCYQSRQNLAWVRATLEDDRFCLKNETT